MRRLLLPVLLLTTLLACKKQQPDYSQRTSYYRNISTGKVHDSLLTVMTYNVQCFFPIHLSPWNINDIGGTPAHLDSLTALLQQSGADVICLQEVVIDRYNITIKHFLDSLAARLGMNYAFGGHGYNDCYDSPLPTKAQWGNAILSKYPITEIENREVSYLDVWTRRSTLRARLQLAEGKLIDVYSLHHKPMYDSSDMIKTAAFTKESPLPKIVAGDFNSDYYTPLYYLGIPKAMPDSLSGIDLIFASPEFHLRSAHYNITSGLSDHDPIWLVMKF